MKKWLYMLLILLLSPALAETVQDQALMFIQEAGIAADSVMRLENDVIVTLTGGGTATLHIPGDFDPYDLNWRFDGAADEAVALYLDHAMTLLAALEAKIPVDTENLPAAQAIRARSYAAVVAKSLACLENTGEQGLRILLAQLDAHDDSNLNSLRARLASRMLGECDKTPVDPAEGLAWYDALVLEKDK